MTLGLRARNVRALSKLLCIVLSAISMFYCDGFFAMLTPQVHAAAAPPLPVAPTGRLFAWTPPQQAGFSLTRITTGFNTPIGIDHHVPTNQVIMSVNYGAGGRPYNFELVGPDGERSPFSWVFGLTDEIKIATVRDSIGGFTPGEFFCGSGAPGQIVRISADGQTVQNPWVTLPGEQGLFRGSLYVDRTGIYGGDLIAVTTAGGVWRINSVGIPSRITQINTHLEGLCTAPNNPAKYGPLAGKILIGAEGQGRLYAVDAAGNTQFFALGINPEDIDIIPENENFFGVDFGGSTLWGAPASMFKDMVGDLLIAQEFPGYLWHVKWDGTKFVTRVLAQVPQWEHVTFSPAGIVEVEPIGEPPVITPPAPVVLEVPYPQTTASVTLSAPVTDPDCNVLGMTWTVDGGPVGMIDTIPSGRKPTAGISTFTRSYTLGTHAVHITANDGHFDASADTTVTIRQIQQPPPPPPPSDPPEVVCELATHSLWPPDHEMIDVGLILSGLNLGPKVTYTVKVFSNDEDEEQSADGKHSPDAVTFVPGGSGRAPLYVRRERTGCNDGRVYLIIVTATDDQGRTSLHCCTVTIPKSQSKKDKEEVAALAAQAEATCTAGGSPITPFRVGDGLVIGPKQVPATAAYLRIAPADATIARGSTPSYTAVTVAPDGTTTAVTPTWSSSAPEIATIEATTGAALGVAIGKTVITAASGNLTGTTTLTVSTPTSPTLPSGETPPPPSGPQTLAIYPNFVRLLASGAAPYTAQRTLPDGTFEDVTALVTWSSGDAAVGSIDAAGAMMVTGAGSTTIRALLDGVTVSGPLVVIPKELVGIDVAPSSATVVVTGRTQTFLAKASYNDCTHERITGNAAWSTSNPALATITPTGVATGVTPGTVEVRITQGGMTGTATLEVQPVRIVGLSVSPAFTQQFAGFNVGFNAIASYNNSTQQFVSVPDWASSDPTIASVLSPHTIRTLKEGTVTITATLQGVSGHATLLVLPPQLQSVSLDPSNVTIPKGTTLQYKATAHYSDGSTPDFTSKVATWASNNPAVATVSSTGLARGLNQGGAAISAFGPGFSAGTSLFVGPAALVAVELIPQNASLAMGVTDQYTARAVFTDGSTQIVTAQTAFSSDTPAIATVTPAGLAKGISLGTTTIRGVYSGMTGTASLTVTPAILVTLVISPLTTSVRKGQTRQFALTGTYTDGTTKDVTSLATWTSDDAGIATVNASGLATGVEQGTTDIHASLESLSIAAHLTVIPAPVVSIAVTPAGSTIPRGFTKQYTAIATRADNSTQDVTATAQWASGDTAVALIAPGGLAFGNGPGTTSLSATFEGVTGTTSVTVTEPHLTLITVSPATATRAKGRTQQYTAAATFDDGTVIDVTGSVAWTTADPAVATISATGLATAVGEGTTAVRATKDGVVGAASITVTPAELVQILVSPANALVPKGLSLQYTATGKYSDNTTQNLTSTATWTSSDPLVATVSATGLATAVGQGISTLKAAQGGLTGSALITGQPPVLQTLTIAPPSAVILKTQTKQFTLTGGYSDGTTQNLTNAATWQSSNPAVATVNATGLATAVNFGTSIISATYQGTTVSAGLGVQQLPPPPQVQVTSPAPDSTVTEAVQIVGSTTSGYKLEYSPVGSGQFFPFGSGTGAVTNGVLGTFDPTVLLNGIYTVRLTATDEFGQSTSTTFEAIADGQVKIGNFTLTFTDLSLPVEGVHVTAFRNYDSRVKTSGDFGIGWRLNLKTMSLQTKDKPGEGGWEAQSVGFLSQYRLVRTGNHYVAITMSDGRVEKFDFEGSASPTFGGIVFNAPVLRPRPGTTSTLEAVTDPEVLFDNGVLFDLSLRIWEPEDYVLTSRNGTKFRLNLRRGLEQVQDRKGNTITISPSGVIHSSGVSISFARDAANRITKITDPMGHTLEYGYDPQGNLTSSKDREGNITTYTYDAKSNLVDIFDPLGRRVTRNEYDESGRLIAAIDADNNRTEFTHQLDIRREIIRDRNGHNTIYDYDARGNIVTLTDALGHTITSTFDSDDNELTRTDQLGRTTTYSYDSKRNRLSQSIVVDGAVSSTGYSYDTFSNVLSMTDPLGKTTFNTYDANGNPLSSTDAMGNLTQNAYSGGRLSSMTDPMGATTEFSYDAKGRVIEQRVKSGSTLLRKTTFAYNDNNDQISRTTWARDAGGVFQPHGTWTTVYDDNSRVIESRDPEGFSVLTEYNAAGQKSSVTDKNGNKTTFTYDQKGMLHQTSFPAIQVAGNMVNPIEECQYDAEGNRTHLKDRNGNTTQTVFDAMNREIRVINPDGGIQETVFDAAGRVIRRKDELSHETVFAHNEMGRVISIKDPLGLETQLVYNAAGAQIRAIDPLGHQTQYLYDALGRRNKTIFHDGSSRSTSHDAASRPVSEIDEAGVETKCVYAPTGELVEVRQADPAQPANLTTVTRYTYDDLGRKIEEIDALGRVTRFTYSVRGDLKSRIRPMGQTESFQLDGQGNVVARTDAMGRTTSFAYNALNLLSSKAFEDGTIHSTSYFPGGQRSMFSIAAGGLTEVTTFGINSRNRLLIQTNPDGSQCSWAYDLVGNRTEVNSPSQNIKYSFNARQEPTEVLRNGSPVAKHFYDAAGNRERVEFGNGVEQRLTYNEKNQLTQVETKRAGSLLASYAYTLDVRGLKTHVTENSGRTINYAFDGLRRLVQERISEGGTTTTIDYGLDLVGNRLRKTVAQTGVPTAVTDSSFNANDELLQEQGSFGTTQYAYNASGETISKVGGGGAVTYAWDQNGRLAGVASSGQTVSLAYDVDGNRTAKSLNGFVTKFRLDRNQRFTQVTEEVDNTGLATNSYVYGDRILSQQHGSGGYFFHSDGQGSTRLLTDSSGSVAQSFDYDAYGNLLQSPATPISSRLFSGEEFDSDTSFYYLRARHLNTALGRFVSRDPHMGSDGEPASLHKYLYGRNNPTHYSDPSGLAWLTNRFLGWLVHDTIGAHFVSMSPGTRFANYKSIDALTGNPTLYGKMRPDLIDIGTGEIYEIKPWHDFIEGAAQLAFYLILLSIADPSRTWVPGTTYVPPPIFLVPGTIATFALVSPPVAGVILYEVVCLELFVAWAVAWAIEAALAQLDADIGQAQQLALMGAY